MPDPFPSELVEAAAKAAMEAEPGQNWECATAKEADVYLRDSLAVLAVVLPLIEQRVIDRLAREAGENPYPEFHLPEHDGATGYADPCHAAWDDGAACGVAAERARGKLTARKIMHHLERAEVMLMNGDPDYAEREVASAHAALLAALAPERTTTPEPEGENG